MKCCAHKEKWDFCKGGDIRFFEDFLSLNNFIIKIVCLWNHPIGPKYFCPQCFLSLNEKGEEFFV